MKAATSFRRVKVSVKDVLPPLIALLFLNCLFLSIWMIFDPLRWIRISTDQFNTRGKCKSEGVVSTIMLTLICLVDLSAVLLANVEAYRSRNVSIEFSESRYIAFCMASILQISIVGLPLLLVVQDNPTAKYFLETCIITIFCFSILLLIFIPKVLALHRIQNDKSIRTRCSNSSSTPSTRGVSRGSLGLKASFLKASVLKASSNNQDQSIRKNEEHKEQAAEQTEELKSKISRAAELFESQGISCYQDIFQQAGLADVIPNVET